MTAAQTAKYWREWGKVRKLLTTLGEFSSKDADAERKQIHLEALGIEKSSKALTNRDLDKIFDAFSTRLALLEGPASGTKAATQPVKRLLWAIDQLGLDAPYIESIARDQFGSADWRNLGEDRLSKLRMTLTRRARAKKRAAAADLDEDPF